jgi:hypothetical protein
MGPRSLLVEPRLGPLALGHGARHPSAMLGFLGRAGPSVGGLTMLAHRLLTTLLQLALLAALGGDPTPPRQREHQPGQHDYDYDNDYDDQNGRHFLYLLLGVVRRLPRLGRLKLNSVRARTRPGLAAHRR